MAQTDTTAAELFERHHLAVFRFFRRLTGQADLAEDLTQEVFLRVVKGVPRYRATGHECGWVFQIARHVLADHIRRPEERRSDISQADLAEAAAAVAAHIAAFDLREALNRLPDAERVVFLLRELAGLTYREIARTCDTTEDAVGGRLYRARARLRQLLCGRLSVGSQSKDQRGRS